MVMRLSGMASGMDTEKMVQDLMKARRVSVDSLWKKKTQLEWKKSDYNTLYKAIKEFRENTVFNTKMSSTLLPKQAVSNNTDVATASANADAGNISHTIIVGALAEGVIKASSAAITTGATKDTLINQFGLDATSTTFQITVGDGTTSKAINVDPTKSVYELVSSINNAGINIKANYDTTLDRFTLYTTKTGSTIQIGLTDASVTKSGGATANFLADVLKINTTTATGKDAEFTLDGVSGLKQATNSFTVSGVTYNIKTLGQATIAVSSDVDKAVANVKKFVDAYNTLLDKINGELKEARYKDYLPLTTTEKTEMKDSQVLLWEDKARSGMLRNDTTLSNFLTSMRNDIATAVSGISGSYTSVSSLGITTSSNYMQGGKLEVDETKLRAALEADPEVLQKVFGTNGSSSSTNGIAVRLYDSIKTAIDKIKLQAGDSASVSDDTTSLLAKNIVNYNKRIAADELRLKEVENRYYKQFDAMERALSKMNSQSSWLSQQFGG